MVAKKTAKTAKKPIKPVKPVKKPLRVAGEFYKSGDPKSDRKAGDVGALRVIQHVEHCGRNCPAFGLCPIMPLAIQPVDIKKRICLVKSGPAEIQRAYKNLFVGGHSGILEEMQRGIIEYGEILRKEGKGMEPAKRLQHIAKLNSMLAGLDRMVAKSGAVEEQGVDDVTIDTGERAVEQEEEDELPEDPESLAYSDMIPEFFAPKEPEKPVNPVNPDNPGDECS